MTVPAQASLIEARPHADFSNKPYVIAFDGGAATYSFSLTDPTPSAIAPASIESSGVALVASYGDPFYDPPRPAAYLGPGIIADDAFATYVQYPDPTGIPFSNARIFIGLQFELHDGMHYGYAELFRNVLISYAYETVPGQPIIIGADPTDPPGAIPEPGSLVLLLSAIAGLLVVLSPARLGVTLSPPRPARLGVILSPPRPARLGAASRSPR